MSAYQQSNIYLTTLTKTYNTIVSQIKTYQRVSKNYGGGTNIIDLKTRQPNTNCSSIDSDVTIAKGYLESAADEVFYKCVANDKEFGSNFSKVYNKCKKVIKCTYLIETCLLLMTSIKKSKYLLCANENCLTPVLNVTHHTSRFRVNGQYEKISI